MQDRAQQAMDLQAPVKHLSSTCQKPVKHLSGTCQAPVRHLSSTYQAPVKHLSSTCQAPIGFSPSRLCSGVLHVLFCHFLLLTVGPATVPGPVPCEVLTRRGTGWCLCCARWTAELQLPSPFLHMPGCSQLPVVASISDIVARCCRHSMPSA